MSEAELQQQLKGMSPEKQQELLNKLKL